MKFKMKGFSRIQQSKRNTCISACLTTLKIQIIRYKPDYK